MEGDPPRPVVKASTLADRLAHHRGQPDHRPQGGGGARVPAHPKVFEDAAFAKKESIASAGIPLGDGPPLWLTSGPDEEGDVIASSTSTPARKGRSSARRTCGS
jgi:hypothetical protein